MRYLIVALLLAFAIGVALDRINERLDSIDTSLQCLVGSTAHSAYTDIFKQHGSPTPEQMAKAVLSTNHPPLMAAVAITESNGDPQAIGDQGKSAGAFQVQNQYWGDVPEQAEEQAQQAQAIIDGLLDSRRCLQSALRYYNGGGSGSPASARYADRVMKLKRNIEKELTDKIRYSTL